MEKITPELIEKAKKYSKKNKFKAFIGLFFCNIQADKKGIHFEEWTSGGVHMMHYFHASDGCYFDQFQEQANNFDVDAEVDLHRQDERYRNVVSIRYSLQDFESYEQYLKEIALLIK